MHIPRHKQLCVSIMMMTVIKVEPLDHHKNVYLRIIQASYKNNNILK